MCKSFSLAESSASSRTGLLAEIRNRVLRRREAKRRTSVRVRGGLSAFAEKALHVGYLPRQGQAHRTAPARRAERSSGAGVE
jgi:hypothetical protein